MFAGIAIGVIVAFIAVPIALVLTLLFSPVHFGSWGSDDNDNQ